MFPVTLDGKPLRGPAADKHLVEYTLEGQEPAASLSIAWQAAESSGSVILQSGMHNCFMRTAECEGKLKNLNAPLRCA